MYRCPLHESTGGCPCNDFEPSPGPFAVGLWRCDAGHRMVAGPTVHQNQFGRCGFCGSTGLERAAVAVADVLGGRLRRVSP